MKEFLKDNYIYILVFGLCFIEFIVWIIVILELTTGKSIIDKLCEVGLWMKSRMKKSKTSE